GRDGGVEGPRGRFFRRMAEDDSGRPEDRVFLRTERGKAAARPTRAESGVSHGLSAETPPPRVLHVLIPRMGYSGQYRNIPVARGTMPISPTNRTGPSSRTTSARSAMPSTIRIQRSNAPTLGFIADHPSI